MDTLIAGSYDRFLFGFECSTSGRDEEAGALKRTFTYAAHKGPVKCVASGLPYIASGGADDLIHLYDLKSGSDLGFLVSPGSGAVSALAWHKPSDSLPPTHLLSGAADGGISVWQAGGDWVCYKTLHSHKKEVTSLSVHSSGRLALSTSRQDDLKLWNLVKGKCVHTTKLGATADQVVFSPNDAQYLVLKERQVLVYAMESGEQPIAKFQHTRKLHCLTSLNDSLWATGSEEGAVLVWDQRTPEAPVLSIPQAHRSRVRGLASLANVGESVQSVASASSDGSLRLWDLRSLQASQSAGTKHIAEAITGARLTCLSSIDLRQEVNPAPKQKRPEVNKSEAAVTKAGAAVRQQALQKSAKASSRKVNKKQALSTGVAHDGVVEFPDEDPKESFRSKKSAVVQRNKNVLQRSGSKSEALQTRKKTRKQ